MCQLSHLWHHLLSVTHTTRKGVIFQFMTTDGFIMSCYHQHNTDTLLSRLSYRHTLVIAADICCHRLLIKLDEIVHVIFQIFGIKIV